MKFNRADFGREIPDDENVDYFIFSKENMNQKYVDRISKCHFYIERISSNGFDNSLSPAILTCVGRNGIFINDVKMNVGDKIILASGDIIKLTRKTELFDVS